MGFEGAHKRKTPLKSGKRNEKGYRETFDATTEPYEQYWSPRASPTHFQFKAELQVWTKFFLVNNFLASDCGDKPPQ